MMAGKIRILSEAVAQKIAAGEVVERPASVVKELVENAIDAGATEIIVELRSGGLQLIRVADNGEGMTQEDVPLALERFATSKIREAEDLYAIQTLGFRGEALPSIASVSKMVLRTRPPHSISGTKVISEGGEIQHLSETGCPVGTEVEVHDLFYNVPVRRKFLKSIRTELRYALLQFHRICLAYPSITFKFIHDGRLLDELIKTDSLWVRVEAVLGRQVVDHLITVRYEEEVRVEGLTGLPSLARANRDGIYTYLHRRYVRDRLLYKAILEAYRFVLPSDKHPVSILLIDPPPSSIDVNVHPTKVEVRFREPEKIYHAIWSSIRGALEETRSTGRHRSPGTIGEGQIHPPQASLSFSPLRIHSETTPDASPPMSRIKEEEVQWEVEKRPLYRIVGQIWGTYILCETEERLLFIDQHAAHERILYEKLKKHYEERRIDSEPLLLPVLLELTLEESILLDAAREDFKAVGFEIESIGERLYAIRSLPSFIEAKEAEERVREILEELPFLKRGGTSSLQALLISLACHSAVRARFPLRKEEIEALIEELYPFQASTTCPHGRPIFFPLSLDEMNRQFRRK